MKRIGAVTLVLALALLISSGCDEETQGVNQTGIEVSFSNCLSFGVYVFVDDLFQGFTSTDEPKFFELPPGSHSLFARSNAIKEGSYFCWTIDISVNDSKTTEVLLDCTDAECGEQ